MPRHVRSIPRGIGEIDVGVIDGGAVADFARDRHAAGVGENVAIELP